LVTEPGSEGHSSMWKRGNNGHLPLCGLNQQSVSEATKVWKQEIPPDTTGSGKHRKYCEEHQSIHAEICARRAGAQRKNVIGRDTRAAFPMVLSLV